MQPVSRRRRVTTCVPCYHKKQKCNRQYPCNHCTRRRRPEECVYRSVATLTTSGTVPMLDESDPRELSSETMSDAGVRNFGPQHAARSPAAQLHPAAPSSNQHSGLAKAFGYFEDSSSNTMALLKQWNLKADGNALGVCHKDELSEVWKAIKDGLNNLPHPKTLDFLVQYFVTELNWMKQVVYAPSFLLQYQKWQNDEGDCLSVQYVEFSVLILRICAYTAQFLPSDGTDSLGGLSLCDVRTKCTGIGDNLAKACVALDWKGSLVRVQHILFAALKSSCDGRTDRFWEGIALACEAAQKAGIHTSAPTTEEVGARALEDQMRRRTFCCLYLLDSHLSRQLDRVPFLPDNLVMEALPIMHLSNFSSNGNDDGAPDVFTERLMQVQLGRFWRSLGWRRNSEYDPIEGEQRYERFCTEFCSSLHPAFALKPDTRWDNQFPKLAMQRMLLQICIFDSICWNFRPLLLLKPDSISKLPPFKQVLIKSQKQRIALAALKELEAVAALHDMLGGSHTRFSAIIFNTFEANVLLLCLCLHEDFPFDMGEDRAQILGLEVAKLTRGRVMRAAERALGRLQMLADVSDMAASGARVVSQLYLKAVRLSGEASPLDPVAEWSRNMASSGSFSNLIGLSDHPGYDSTPSDHSKPGLMDELISDMTNDELSLDVQLDFKMTEWSFAES